MNLKTPPKIVLLLFVLTTLAFSQEKLPIKLSLNQAIELAYKNNENILIAGNDVQTARAQIREAWADALPEVRFNGLYTRNFKQQVFFFPDPATGKQRAFRIGSRNSYLLSLTVEQPLFQSGKVTGGIKAANLFKKLSNQRFQAVQADVVLAVKKAYYTVQLDEQLLAIDQQSLDQRLAHLINSRKLFLQGQVAELDTLRAWVDYTNLQPGVYRMESNLRIAENQLKQIVGLDLEQEITLAGALDYDPTDGISIADVYQEAFQKRPELKQLRFQAAILKHNIGITRADRLPKLFFSASYDNIAQSDQFDFGSGFNSSISGTLRLEVPIFTGLRTLAKVQQAKLSYKNAEYQIQMFEDNLKIELKTIYLNIKEAEKRVEAQQHAINQSERAFRIAQRRYNEGVGTQLELGDALLALNVSKTNYARAVYDHRIALAELEKAIGRP
ncbi:MAG: TolC family protein [bacterium]